MRFLNVIYTKTPKPVHAKQGQLAPIKCAIHHRKPFAMTNTSSQWPASWGVRGRLIGKVGENREEERKAREIITFSTYIFLWEKWGKRWEAEERWYTLKNHIDCWNINMWHSSARFTVASLCVKRWHTLEILCWMSSSPKHTSRAHSLSIWMRGRLRGGLLSAPHFSTHFHVN